MTKTLKTMKNENIQEPTFKEKFEQWQQETYDLWVKLKSEGYTQEQLLEMLWGKETLATWRKGML